MRKIVLFVGLLAACFVATAQEIEIACAKFNSFNSEVLKTPTTKALAAQQFKELIAHIQHALITRSEVRISEPTWIFPLQGDNYHAVGGNGDGYFDKGYRYIDGNKHAAHPAHDIFINDRNQDCIDDRTQKPVNVVAADDGIIIACSNEWEPASSLRGGRYIWIYHNYSGVITYYAHNSAIFVKPGDEVKPGQKIAEVGRTGYNAYKKRSPTHLHFSAFRLVDDIPVPFNPYQQLKKAKTL
jgi:murein DD-endopeptidase MepM/ murein hydrolase activator NlpD